MGSNSVVQERNSRAKAVLAALGPFLFPAYPEGARMLVDDAHAGSRVFSCRMFRLYALVSSEALPQLDELQTAVNSAAEGKREPALNGF